MEKLLVTQIWIYPIKSCGGLQLTSVKVNPKGLGMDRRWMLVDKDGKKISQREIPEMGKINIIQTEDGYLIGQQEKNSEDIFLPFNPQKTGTIVAKIWEDKVAVKTMLPEYDKWFSDILDTPCRLVFIDENIVRSSIPTNVGLADGDHSLIISQQSVDLLNEKLTGIQVSPSNFRPNIVFAGGEPHLEDGWVGKDLHIGNATFTGRKICGRCKIVTIDPNTSVSNPIIMKKLASYRFKKEPSKNVFFGLNLSSEDTGKVINIGDEIIV